MATHDKDWIVYVARAGYSAKCVVYCVLGILIVYSAFTLRGASNVSKKSVYQEILSTPFGSISLSLVAVGLACYVVWRLIQGVLNPDDLDMSSPKEVILRVFYFLSAVAYGSATYVAVDVLIGLSGGQGSSKEQMGNSIMQETWGVFAAGALGLLVIAFAFIQFKHAYKRDFMDKFVLNEMSSSEKQHAKNAGTLGYAARGVIYTMVGGFIIHAAFMSDADKAGGLSKALSTLIQQPFGPWLLGCLVL